MKKIVILLVFIYACTNQQPQHPNAENALDAGREYINACLQGDFSKAHAYLNSGKLNDSILAETEKIYRNKDKEGRQQLRTASIQINELKEVNDTLNLLYYSNSFERKRDTLRIIKTKNGWLVDVSNQINKRVAWN